MSMHYDLVITCDLREDTPEPCIEMIRWLCDRNSNPETKPEFDCFSEEDQHLADNFDFPFLAPFPDEEIISVFQKRYRYTMPANAGGRDVYRYGLQFSARDLVDDSFYECHFLFVYWLASIAEDGFIGYCKERLDNEPTLLYVKNRKLAKPPYG